MDEQLTLPDAGAENNIQGPAQVLDPTAILAEVERFYTEKLQDRKPYEMEWYQNAAALRGFSQATFHPIYNRLHLKDQPKHRRKKRINRIRIKVLAKVAKLVNSRPRPIVIPASTDREDIYNAKGAELVYNYLWRKLNLEAKYEAALFWAEITGKAFWWISWDPTAMAKFKTEDMFGRQQVTEQPAGDARVDLGTAFEVLIDDPGIEDIGKQEKIMRVRAERVRDFEARHPKWRGKLHGDAHSADLFQFQRQIADLGTQMLTGMTNFSGSGRGGDSAESDDPFLLRKEFFQGPSASYPKGRYALVAGRQLIDYRESLPFGYSTLKENPYPTVEFQSEPSPGQFWPTTITEQLRPIQEERNDIRTSISEALVGSMHRKLVSPRQARIPANANNSEANEKIEYHFIPGMPPPFFLDAGGVSTDAWRVLDMTRQEEDEVTNIFPDSLGGGQGKASSGFQTNLLQEAADAVYGPHRRKNERALEDAYRKIGILASLGYDVERLISFAGRGNIPHVISFKGEQIDPHAEIIVQIGSALSDHKTTRVQEILELHGAGLFNGDPASRRVLQMIDLGGVEQEIDVLHRDESAAQLENQEAFRGQPLKPPAPWEEHPVHIGVHFDFMKGPEWNTLQQPQQIELGRHVTLHLVEFGDLQMAMKVAQTFQQQDLIQSIGPMLQQQMMAQQAMGPAGPPGPPGPGGPPQPAPPQ